MDAPYQIDSVREVGGAHHIELSPLEHAVFGSGLPQRGRIDLFIEDADAADAWLAAQKTGQGVTVTFALSEDAEDAPEHHKHHDRHEASPVAYGEAVTVDADEEDEEDEEKSNLSAHSTPLISRTVGCHLISRSPPRPQAWGLRAKR